MSDSARRPLRVLFVCLQNSARSQIAEGLLRRKGKGKFMLQAPAPSADRKRIPSPLKSFESRGLIGATMPDTGQ